MNILDLSSEKPLATTDERAEQIGRAAHPHFWFRCTKFCRLWSGIRVEPAHSRGTPRVAVHRPHQALR